MPAPKGIYRHADLQVGARFGRLVVVSATTRTWSSGRVMRYYETRCDCGKTAVVSIYNLIKGEVQSCGCLQAERALAKNLRHGGCGSRLYRVWNDMRNRCYTPSATGYKIYGGRGINVCDEWSDFSVFQEFALASGYRADLTMDRIDVNGDYEPGNVRWIPWVEQARNRRNTWIIEAWGERKRSWEWADDPRCHVPVELIQQRMRRGWSAEDAMTYPAWTRKQGKRKRRS